MKFKTIVKPLIINKTCSCGTIHLVLPTNHKVTDNGDVFDGIYFECKSCDTTLMITKCQVSDEVFKEAV